MPLLLTDRSVDTLEAKNLFRRQAAYQPGGPATAGPVLVREPYQDRQWSSPQIAAHLDRTVKTVLRTLHDHGVPERRRGGRAAR